MYEEEVSKKLQKEQGQVLTQFMGKMVSAVVLTEQDVRDGFVTIQFTDGTSLSVAACCHEECKPWLSFRAIPGVHGQVKLKGPEKRDNAPFDLVDDDCIGSTEDSAPFHPVDHVNLDEL